MTDDLFATAAPPPRERVPVQPFACLCGFRCERVRVDAEDLPCLNCNDPHGMTPWTPIVPPPMRSRD